MRINHQMPQTGLYAGFAFGTAFLNTSVHILLTGRGSRVKDHSGWQARAGGTPAPPRRRVQANCRCPLHRCCPPVRRCKTLINVERHQAAYCCASNCHRCCAQAPCASASLRWRLNGNPETLCEADVSHLAPAHAVYCQQRAWRVGARVQHHPRAAAAFLGVGLAGVYRCCWRRFGRARKLRLLDWRQHALSHLPACSLVG